jgi:hypothetical protein
MAMNTSTPVDYWMAMPLRELLEWSAICVDILEEAQARAEAAAAERGQG